MPITFWTFVIGSLSLAGIFPLAGFWSKDEILKDAWLEDKALWGIAFIVAFMTAFYMFRAIFLTFFGSYKGGQPVDHHDPESHFHGDPAHPHESAWVMTIPLIILAIPAIGAGVFNMTGITDGFGRIILGALPEHEVHALEFDWGIALSSTAAAVAGIAVAWAIYEKRVVSSSSLRDAFYPFARVLENKYFLDRLYEDFFARTVLQRGWNRLLEAIDRYVVDGAVDGSATVARFVSQRVRVVQTGQLQTYGLAFGLGVIILVAAVFTADPL
jgi:NADH-quinone oxidoreductase subunit L